MAASILDLLNVSRELTPEFFSQRLHVLNSHSRRRATLKETTAKSHPTGIPLPEMLHGSTPLSWRRFSTPANTCRNIPRRSKSCRTALSTGSSGKELQALQSEMCC